MSNSEWIDLILAALMVCLFMALLRFSYVLWKVVDILENNIDRTERQAARLEETVNRMEKADKEVATNLAATREDLSVAARQRTTQGETLDRMEEATYVVKDNLAESVKRADDSHGSEGAAADAALRSAVQ